MSKIEVNAIEPQCGTTLTVGASGDTITFPTGTTIVNNGTQTGFGRTGTVDWITTPKTATFSAVSGEGYFCNTSGGAFTVNLPAGAAGAIVSLADYAATWQTNNVTVTPNGTDKIGGRNVSVNLDTEGQSVTFVFVDSTQGWVNTMDSTSNVRGNPNLVATVSGACNTLVTAPCCANVKIATFTGPGSFTVTNAAVCAANNVVSYMVVAGGGTGGKDYPAGTAGAGAGAGGFREYKSPVTPYTASPLDGNPGGTAITVSAQAYAITVGGGGAANPAGISSTVYPGSNSVFSSIVSTGGSGGSNVCSESSNTAPQLTGGSGGGNTYYDARPTSPQSGGGAGNTPPVSPSQGNAGGNGSPDSGNGYRSGGGGGAGAAGLSGAATPTVAGDGGAGVATSITGSSVTRAGGGGGGFWGPTGPHANGGVGGAGGGGAGGPNPNTAGIAGTVNTGSGGGGGTGDNPVSSGASGGQGGSGIVVIRYKFQ